MVERVAPAVAEPAVRAGHVIAGRGDTDRARHVYPPSPRRGRGCSADPRAEPAKGGRQQNNSGF